MDKNTYTGFRAGGKIYVSRGERPLSLPASLIRRLKLTAGFSWGDDSLSAKSLAFVLLLDASGQSAPAIKWYEEYHKIFVRSWPADKGWMKTRAEILAWLDAKENPPKPATVQAPIAEVPRPGEPIAEVPRPMEAIPPKRRKPE